MKSSKFLTLVQSVKSSKGIALMTALFLVLLITVIVNEINFETNVEYTVNSQAINRVKAYYAAKSGVELSKLRIKIYQEALKQFGSQPGVPSNLLDMVYNQPFVWPLLTVGDMNSIDKDAINKINKESWMDASYQTQIQTEERLNINDLNSPVEPQKDKVRQKLIELFKSKIDGDDEWAKNHRDLKYEEIINNIEDYLDADTISKNGGDESSRYDRAKELDKDTEAKLPPNRWFQSINELRLVPGITDEIFEFLAPVLTVYGPFFINPNRAEKTVIKSLHKTFTDEVVEKIISRRDNPSEGGPYQDKDDFFNFANRSGARVDPSEYDKLPIDVKEPCHFRISSTGNYGKVTSEITAITYDLECQRAEVSSKLPSPTGSPQATANPKSSGPLPKGPPRVVYWEER